jgi:hypothetical protein
MTGRLRVWLSCVAPILAANGIACDAQPSADEVIQGAGDGGTPGACTALEACCPTLPTDVVTSCDALSKQADDTECGTLLAALESAHRCLAGDAGMPEEAAAPVDARATSKDATAKDGEANGPAVACTLLGTCCTSPALPSGEMATCTSVEGTNEESLCASLLTSLTASQSCGATSAGQGGACPELEQCCSSESFPDTFSTSCLATWNAGKDAACAAMLTMFVGAGYCGGTLGPQPDPDCVTLAMCCNELKFPADQLTTCQAIVAGNEGGNCLSAYDTYCGGS